MRNKKLQWALTIVMGSCITVLAAGWNDNNQHSRQTTSNRKGTTASATDWKESAIKKALVAYESNPKGCVVNTRLGYLYYASGKYANSEYHYKNALRANKYSVNASLGLYLINMQDKRYDVAETYCRRVTKRDPLNFYANIYLANSLESQKKYTDASETLRRLQRYYPTNIVLLVALKQVYLAQNETTKVTKLQETIALLQGK